LKHLAPRSVLILTALWFVTATAPASAAAISVSITSQNPQAPVPGSTVAFTAKSGTSGVSWYWDFNYTGGQGHFAQGSATMSHAYTAHGSYTVVVYVSDSSGNSGYATRTVKVGTPPTASIALDPAAPQAGQTVTFTSTSASPDSGGEIKGWAWDLNGDGNYDEGSAATATKVFDAEGDYSIGLRVTDDLGYTATKRETYHVSAPAPPATADPQPDQPQPADGAGFDTSAPQPAPDPGALNPAASLKAFSPMPFIRIKGHTTGHGAQIDLFSVRGARGALVRVRCVGKACPKKSSAHRVIKSKRGTGTVRFGALQGWFREGTLLEVRVTKKGFVGRYTRFRIGKLKPPVRWDGCMMPSAKAPVEC
jgi:PKD repeat protein